MRWNTARNSQGFGIPRPPACIHDGGKEQWKNEWGIYTQIIISTRGRRLKLILESEQTGSGSQQGQKTMSMPLVSDFT